MGRPRSFDEEQLLTAAAEVFTVHGYEGTSIDDLVAALQVHRGSLYQAFGSKRGLFLATLRRYVARLAPQQSTEPVGQDEPSLPRLDLLLVAALERGHRDEEVAELVAKACAFLSDGPAPIGAKAGVIPNEKVLALLGFRIYQRGTSSRRRSDA